MDINSMQGTAAYANAPGSTPPVENTQPRDQNIEASRTDLDAQTTKAAQEAFEVTITEEARAKLSEEDAVEEAPTQDQLQAPPPEPKLTEPVQTSNDPSQIVNIVA